MLAMVLSFAQTALPSCMKLRTLGTAGQKRSLALSEGGDDEKATLSVGDAKTKPVSTL